MLLDMICKELGVEIGEIWEGNDGKKYYINKHGQLITVEYKFFSHDEYYVKDNIERVLTGELIPEWTPEVGDYYYTSNVREYPLKKYNKYQWSGDTIDLFAKKHDLIFKTKEEAVAETNKMMDIVKSKTEFEELFNRIMNSLKEDL